MAPFGMSDAECERFREQLSESSNYLEFGCGGSTRIALELPLRRIYSVETDPDWIKKLADEQPIQAALSEGRLSFHNRDLGELRTWGFPATRKHLREWPYFSLGVWSEIEEPVDFVFVDGRFRVACALAAMLMATEDAVVAMHDFSGREHYEEVLKYSTELDRLGSSIYLKRDDNVADRTILIALYEHLFDPR